MTASLPKFLAPGDRAELRLDIANTDGPAGDYQLQVTTNGPVTVEQTAAEMVNLGAGGKSALTLPLAGQYPGDGLVTVRLSNASGLSLEQTLNIPVRPAALPVTQRHVVNVAAGSSLTVDEQLLADSLLQGASVSLNVTRSAAFDVPALLMTLDRYPYGCAERRRSAPCRCSISASLQQAGLADDEGVKKRVQEAIYRVLAYHTPPQFRPLGAPAPAISGSMRTSPISLPAARSRNSTCRNNRWCRRSKPAERAELRDQRQRPRQRDRLCALCPGGEPQGPRSAICVIMRTLMLGDFPTPLAKPISPRRSRSMRRPALAGYLRGRGQHVDWARQCQPRPLRLRLFASRRAAVLALAAESRPVPPIIPELSRVVARNGSRRDTRHPGADLDCSGRHAQSRGATKT